MNSQYETFKVADEVFLKMTDIFREHDLTPSQISHVLLSGLGGIINISPYPQETKRLILESLEIYLKILNLEDLEKSLEV